MFKELHNPLSDRLGDDGDIPLYERLTTWGDSYVPCIYAMTSPARIENSLFFFLLC